jgi:hypothetical protein
MSVELGRHVIAPVAARAIRVRDVAGGLLEVGHEPAPLEHLGQDIGRALAGEVHAAELGHGVVAVFREHALVEPLRPRRAHGRRGPRRRLLEEFIEEKPAERLGRARVAGEERTLDDFGQVDESKDRSVEIGEVRREGGPLLGSVRLHGGIVARVSRGTPWRRREV